MFKTFLNSILILSVFIVSLLSSSSSQAADVDPTRPFGASGSGTTNQAKQDGGFVLSSIIHGDGIHTAVINGSIYKMFDYIGEYRITAINSHSVILRSKSKHFKIHIFKSKGFQSNVVNSVAN